MRHSLATPHSDDLKSAIRRFESGLYEQAGVQLLAILEKNPADSEALYYLRLVERRLARTSAPAPATLIWQFDPKIAWETDWLRLVLDGRYTKEIVDNSWSQQAPTMIVVDNRLVPEKLPYYQRAFHSGCRIILVHLSDEAFMDDYGFYRFCDGIIRNYQSELLADFSRIHAIPLGFKAGFARAGDTKPIQARKYLWSFAGDAKKLTRQPMLGAMEALGGGFTHLTQGFGSADALPIHAYRALLDDSVVVPCPGGWSNLETFRVYEALEAGCIPIVEKRPGFEYFTRLLGPHPLPTVATWSEAAELIGQLKTTDGLEALRQACATWWAARKPIIARDVKDFMGRVLA